MMKILNFISFLVLSLIFLIENLVDNICSKAQAIGLYSVPCATGALATNDNCEQRGGISTIFWCNYDDIDWVAMAGSTTKWDAATLTIKEYTMVGAAVFNELSFERKTPQYAFTYTDAQDYYEQLIQVVFEGKSIAQANKFRAATSCCQLIAHIVDTNGNNRVVGVEWTGTKFIKQLTPLKIGRHLDTSGQLGQSKSRDEIDLTGQSIKAPLWALGSIVPPVD